jgi:polyphosphate kinase 2 (PPK2 family)
MGRLDELDLALDLPKQEAKTRLEAAQERMQEIRLELAGLDGDPHLGPPLCVVLEGWDASGKGGAIKRLVAKLDPRHVRVKQYAAPTVDELRHPWLWRFWPALPGWGGMAILDRSWYGRVLVERVEGFATAEEWQRAYDEINGFVEGDSKRYARVKVIETETVIAAAEEGLRRHGRRRAPGSG